MKPYYQDEAVTIYHGDCREILPILQFDAIITDPPYPDQHLEYGNSDIIFLDKYKCKQFIFWSAKVDFPLDYTAIHIWDKQTGCASEYERIFERYGQYNYKVWNYNVINCQRSASYQRDIFYGHPSQKPFKLIDQLVVLCKDQRVIIDPFLGSGTVAYCAKRLGHKCIGIEAKERYCEIAANRCRQGVMQLV